jgi:hypothetical protein
MIWHWKSDLPLIRAGAGLGLTVISEDISKDGSGVKAFSAGPIEDDWPN